MAAPKAPTTDALPDTAATCADPAAVVFEHAPDAFFLTDDAMGFVEANPAAARLLGYTREEFLRLRFAGLIYPGDRPGVDQAWAAFLAAARAEWEWRMVGKDGRTRYAEVRGLAHVRPGLHLLVARDLGTAPPPEAVQQPDPIGFLRTRGTVLLAEDEEAVRQFVRLVLEQAGYAVVAATDGDHALELFRADPDRFDLLLSDVLMPTLTGPELADEVRRLRPSARVLFMSGYTGGTATRPVSVPDGVPLVEKPFTLDRLLAAVANALSGE